MFRLDLVFNPKTRLRDSLPSPTRDIDGGWNPSPFRVVPASTPKVQRLTRCWPRWHAFDGFDDTDEPTCWPVAGMPHGERARLVRSADHWEIHRLVNGSWMLAPGVYPDSLSALAALEDIVFQADRDDNDS
jgi:hypothetical protein